MGEVGLVAVALVVGCLVGGAIYLGVRARQSGKAIVERDQLRDGHEEERDARKSIKARAQEMRDRVAARARRPGLPHD